MKAVVSAYAWRKLLAVAAWLACAAVSCAADSAGNALDTIVFGDGASEASHEFVAAYSEIIRGGLDQPARRLLPLAPVSHNGGSLTFRLKVDPERQNYFTIKLWGSDRGAASGRLVLYLDGLQAGYRHEGDHDVLNQCDAEAIFQGRFLYQTVMLPPARTHGRTSVVLTIAGLGPMWSYGTTFAQKQRPLTQPTRSLYAGYTHRDPRFVPVASEVQGRAPDRGVRPAGPGEEIIEQMRATVNTRLQRLLDGPRTGEADGRDAEGKILLLAEAYGTPWTVAYRNPQAIAALVRVGDTYLRPGIIGRPWTGAGPLGEAILRVGSEPLAAALAEEISVPAGLPFVPDQRGLLPGEELSGQAGSSTGGSIHLTRREAWARVLRASVDWNRTSGRRFYTNQSMIVDRNIYTANRGLQVIDPSRALPEAQARRYVLEAMGAEPWRGNDLASGEGSTNPYGSGYFQITRKGLSRELGWVGTYGETILKFGRDLAELTGDERVRRQLLKIQAARMYFRYPSLDPDGYRVMKLCSEIDNRTAHFPLQFGAYGIPDIREAWWMELPAFLRDPVSVGAAQQCLEDHQYFFRLAARANDPDTLGMMRNVDEYATVQGLPPSSFRLPMTPGQPDFVFADEENAVLALKRGEQRLFVNFYFRQEFGVSGVTRILEVGPAIMRIATVKADFALTDTGRFWVRPDVIDFERAGGLPPPGEDLHQAWRGEQLPIARRPEDASQPDYGKWGPFVGKAEFYSLHFGDYLIGLNTSATQRHVLSVPTAAAAVDLVSGRAVTPDKPVDVGPLTTVVLGLRSTKEGADSPKF